MRQQPKWFRELIYTGQYQFADATLALQMMATIAGEHENGTQAPTLLRRRS
jgi:hypothetical protein